MTERIETGIPGLDERIQGGLPARSVTLVTGGPGAGKTLFCCQYLWHGLQDGDNGAFITMEESTDDILRDASEFGWDFDRYRDQGDFTIDFINPFRVDTGFDEHVTERIQDIDADRAVIDSTSVLGMYSSGRDEVRRQLYDLIKELKQQGVTTLLTAERPDNDHLSRYGVEEYVADGVILLTGTTADTGRSLQVVKMRRTDTPETASSIAFTGDGLTLT